MKEQGKNPPDQTNEDEIHSLPEKEFRVMTLKMIQNLGNRMGKIQETFNKDLEELKSKQTMMNNTINEIKNSLEWINSRITESEEWISDLEDNIVDITTAEQNKEKRMKWIEARIEKIQEIFNKDLEELKNKQTEMNNTVTEMKNTLEGINNNNLGKRTNKWAGRQNGGNNSQEADYRKKNEKNWRQSQRALGQQ